MLCLCPALLEEVCFGPPLGPKDPFEVSNLGRVKGVNFDPLSLLLVPRCTASVNENSRAH